MIKPDPEAFQCLQAIMREAARRDIIHDVPIGRAPKRNCKRCGAPGQPSICAYCGVMG